MLLDFKKIIHLVNFDQTYLAEAALINFIVIFENFIALVTPTLAGVISHLI